MNPLTTPDHEREYMTVAQVAAELACSEPTVRRRIRAGELPAVPLGLRGSGVRILHDALVAWLWAAPTEDSKLMPRLARTQKADVPAPLFEATQSFASECIEQNALDDFPTGVVQKGLLVRVSHPILKAHPQWFIPARAGLHEGRHAGERIAVPREPA
jgi:excisionase family DNA binding protein